MKKTIYSHCDKSTSTAIIAYTVSKIVKGFLLFVSLILPSTLLAQPGTLDLTFTPGTASNSSIYSIATQDDGKLIIGGMFTAYNGSSRYRIARLNTNGTLDATFNPGTGANDVVLATAIQSDGKVLAGGWFSAFNGSTQYYLTRLNSNGSVDASFNQGTGLNSTVSSIAVQSDGKILLGGYFSSYNGTSRRGIARLNSDGTLDETFNPGTGTDGVDAIAIQSDGKILIGGNSTTFNGISQKRIARLNTDGTLDETFNPGNGANDRVNVVTLLSDGKILIGGAFTTFNDIACNRFARLNADGTLDESFNTGTGCNGVVKTISVQSNGKIVIGGEFTSYNETERNRIARIEANGTLDESFNTAIGANNSINVTSIQTDGKIVICGSFTSFDGITINRIAKLFSETTVGINEIPNQVHIYPNPSKGQFKIEVDRPSTMTLTDLNGKLITDRILQMGSTDINTLGLLSGIYILRVSNSIDIITKRIVIL